MHDLLNRILHVKRLLLALALAMAAFLVNRAGEIVANTPALRDLSGFWWGETSAALLGACLAIFVDAYFSREREAADDERFRRILREEAPAMRRAVIEGFAFEPDELAQVATPATLDQIIENSLAIRLDDKQFASELYRDIRDQAVGSSERWFDTRVSIHLSPLPMGSGGTGGSSTEQTQMFVVTTTWEYTVAPAHATRHFTCVSDETAYRDVVEQGGNTSAWYFRPVNGIDGGDKEAFELVQFSVDGVPRNIHRRAQGKSQTYSVEVGRDIVERGEQVVISYTTRTLVRQSGHLINIDIEQPSRGLAVELDYTECAIQQVRVLPFFPSSKRPRFLNMPESVPDRTVSVAIDGWLMPDSGVALVWVLDREVLPQPARHMAVNIDNTAEHH